MTTATTSWIKSPRLLRREADPADPMSREAALRTIGRIVGVETRGPRDTYQKLWG